MDVLNKEIDTIATRRFMNCLRGIGKTSGMVENVKNYIDEVLLFKKEFEILVICLNLDEKKMLREMFSNYSKYIDLKTMQEVMYKLSEFPIDEENPYDIPRIDRFKWAFGEDKHYEKYFVDPSCYEALCIQQMDKLQKIKELCL